MFSVGASASIPIIHSYIKAFVEGMPLWCQAKDPSGHGNEPNPEKEPRQCETRPRFRCPLGLETN